MPNDLTSAKIKAQIALNKLMRDNDKISLNAYSRANEILSERLTLSKKNDIIALSENLLSKEAINP